MWFPTPTDLEPLPELNLGGDTTDLPQIRPSFFFTPLKDKPQDPILEGVRLAQSNPPTKGGQYDMASPGRGAGIPKELAILTADLGGLTELVAEEDLSARSPVAFWSSVFDCQKQASSSILSWDRLRSTHSGRATTTAFLSEQQDGVLASARYSLHPESSQLAHEVSIEELHRSLRMTTIGASSRLFKWDTAHDRFVYVAEDTRNLRIKERDEVISTSIIDRFLIIGMLLRRLEEFIKVLQLRTVKDGPTVHALAHSLSTVLIYLRETLFKVSFTNDANFLAAVWSKYEPYEDILNALSDLYGRGSSASPKDYPAFDASPVNIISLIYQQLSLQFERQSSTTITAIFAYILEATSKGYLREIGVSVGFGGQPRKSPPRVDEDSEDYYALDDEGEFEENIFQELERIQTVFPDFFPKPLLDLLPTAQKSLILLRRARPDHLLLGEESKHKRVRWLWAEHDILTVWDEVNGGTPHTSAPGSSFQTPAVGHPNLGPTYPPEIAASFQIFDMDPGSFRTQSALQVIDRSSSILESFIEQFPARLPPVTPTLEHLTSLVFRKLLDHASTLSTTLLSIFLTSSDNLNFRLHLQLLRGYLLATEPSFKTRLLDALFSDSGEYGVDEGPHGMSIRSARRRKTKNGKPKASKQPWAVGISGSLLEREIWPPVSGDLSFFLRTVIVDSLETHDARVVDHDQASELGDAESNSVVSGSGDGERRKQHIVLEEAAWRVGFAIRDLPVGNGKQGWMNPLSIEALDFLYIDYKPPRPMDVLISPHILAKYQRIFAFILRLFRVESAVKSLFRITNHPANSPFPTLTKHRKMVLHFRFIAQSFVATLSSYVFDTAIGGNFDPFLDQLSSSMSSTPTGPSDSEPLTMGSARFMDVFELAAAHSILLDRILTACLLRSGQKAVGDILGRALELILEFCVIVGELHRERLKEYEAAGMVEDVSKKFKTKMATFAKILKSLVDKGPSSTTTWALEGHAVGTRRPTGGTAALHHLLMRLDLGEWWSQGKY